MNLPEETRQAIREAIFSGQTITAIKLVREAAGCGLKEAKDFVDGLAVELRAKEPERFQASARRGCVGLVFILVAGVLAVAGIWCGVWLLVS